MTRPGGSSVPSAVWMRSARVSRAVLRSTIDGLALGGESLSDSRRDMIVSLLSDLRGLAVKVGQWLAEEDDLLPAEITRALATAHRSIEPMQPAQVQTLVRQALGRPPEDLFEIFEGRAFAAASIGQVHRARHRDHGPLAVKVQYPRLASTIRADLSVLRGAMTVVPWARPHRGVVTEVAARFEEELDYRREAVNQLEFARRLGDVAIDCPHPVRELSCETVLTMTLLEGRPIRAWAADAAQGVVDAIASQAYALWNRGFVDHGWIHGDPSPGNLLVDGDRLQVIDMGCARAISPPVSAVVRTLLDHPERAGDGTTLELYRDLGVTRGAKLERGPYEELLAPLERWLAGPARPAGLDFATHASWPTEGRSALGALVRRGAAFGVHPEFVLLFRAYYALFRIFQHLGANVRRVELPARLS